MRNSRTTAKWLAGLAVMSSLFIGVAAAPAQANDTGWNPTSVQPGTNNDTGWNPT
jgi:hypothetical protein